MNDTQQVRTLTLESISNYEVFLGEEEKSTATIQQYIHALMLALNFLSGIELTKAALLEWKNSLVAEYAASSVNSFLTSLNGFLKFMGWNDLLVKLIKVQKALFYDERRELTKDEYERLVRAAEDEGNRRLSLVIQTICSTGIRVSELQFITVQAVQTGRTEVFNKGKRRTILLPKDLRHTLTRYLKEQGITSGPVFVTKCGKPLDRSNIWRDMKKLCESAGVDSGKVFPHNLRHLFARTYYTLEKDLSRLADILGHSSINITRIYTMESGTIHAQQIERLGLVIT